MADYFKGVLKAGGKDVDNRSVSEIIDTVGYFAFPNGHFFLAPSFPIVYRFRPLGMDPTRALFDLMQEGMAASRKRAATLANYQESRIRHMHETLDKYLA